MWRSRMFWRLFGSIGLLLTAAIAGLGALVLNRAERHYLEQIESSLRGQALLMREWVQGRPASAGPQLQQQIESAREETGTRITLLDSNGNVLADSDKDPRQFDVENHLDRPEVREARQSRFGLSRRRHSSTVDQDMMYVALRTDDQRGAVAYVRVALPLDRVQGQLAGLRWIVATAGLVTGIASLVLAFWLARRIARPIQELTASTERVAAGEYGHKVYAIGQDEVGTLARTFNHMSERLASQFAQMEEDRQKLRTVLSGMVEGVIAIDADQSILFANERAGQLLEFEASAAVGRKLWELVRQRPIQEVVRCALAEGNCRCEELNWTGPTEKSLTVHLAQLSGSPTRGAVLVLHDTTELRRLERLRQEFVANVSHELKTPLSVIKAAVETLLEGAADDPEHRRPFLEKIADQSDRLHALILDLLSLARIESSTEIFEFKDVPLDPIIMACLERHRSRAESRSQALAAVNGQETTAPVAVWADEEAVAQILDNLVDNAVKYTPPGGRIQVGWRIEDDQVCLDVTDTGIGIPEQDLPRIFERFYRVDKARSRELGGTGLGLSIVKHLVQAMHGTVQCQSQPGQGSTFTVRLPRGS